MFIYRSIFKRCCIIRLAGSDLENLTSVLCAWDSSINQSRCISQGHSSNASYDLDDFFHLLLSLLLGDMHPVCLIQLMSSLDRTIVLSPQLRFTDVLFWIVFFSIEFSLLAICPKYLTTVFLFVKNRFSTFGRLTPMLR